MRSESLKYPALVVLTALSIGRAMTLPFIARAGDGGPGDPPDAWLMPLVADAVIGITAIGVVVALIRHQSLAVWAGALVFHAVAAFDAVAALLVELSTPWPEFFMIRALGRSMFIAAMLMHLVAIYLLSSPELRLRFGVATRHTAAESIGGSASMA